MCVYTRIVNLNARAVPTGNLNLRTKYVKGCGCAMANTRDAVYIRIVCRTYPRLYANTRPHTYLWIHAKSNSVRKKKEKTRVRLFEYKNLARRMRKSTEVSKRKKKIDDSVFYVRESNSTWRKGRAAQKRGNDRQFMVIFWCSYVAIYRVYAEKYVTRFTNEGLNFVHLTTLVYKNDICKKEKTRASEMYFTKLFSWFSLKFFISLGKRASSFVHYLN